MGYRDIEPKDIYTLEDVVLVDIRSPQEFEEFHIPGAVNVPLFENDEKKLIGYIYREEGVDKAKEVGERLAREKLGEFYRVFKELKERHSHVVVYCWRGGMRSQGMCKAMPCNLP
jgi:tRNA 2-selenouridine synthase